MRKSTSFVSIPMSALALGVALASSSVVAEEWALEEVVVTAQKRAQSAQDIPVAVSALSGDMMKEIGGVTAQDIVAYTPGLTGSVDGGVSFTAWGIRGISTNVFGIGTEPSVGVYQDNGYIGRNLQAGAPMYDINRVEVVKGPQGTLFGRNAVAGAISIHTEKPSTEETTLTINGAVGNEDQGHGELVANLPIGDNFAVRVAGLYDHLGGVDEKSGLEPRR